MDQSAPQPPVPDPAQVSSVVHQLQDEIMQLEQQSHHQKQEALQAQAEPLLAADPYKDWISRGQGEAQIPDSLFQDKPFPVNPGPQLVSSRDKERQMTGGPSSPEYGPIREISHEMEPPAEIQEWVEEVPDPQTITLPKPVEDEYGEILLQATQIPKPNITLPIDEAELEKALHHKIAESVRWLGEWCKRTIMLYPGRVFYNKH